MFFIISVLSLEEKYPNFHKLGDLFS
jgi:hypothetical protein